LEGPIMGKFVFYQNIVHYLSPLDRPDLLSTDGTAINQLLGREEDKLAYALESLAFAEERLADCQKWEADLKRLRDGFQPNSPEWEMAGQVQANFKATTTILWKSCHWLRQQIDQNLI
jgi:hypothetical protein